MFEKHVSPHNAGRLTRAETSPRKLNKSRRGGENEKKGKKKKEKHRKKRIEIYGPSTVNLGVFGVHVSSFFKNCFHLYARSCVLFSHSYLLNSQIGGNCTFHALSIDSTHARFAEQLFIELHFVRTRIAVNCKFRAKTLSLYLRTSNSHTSMKTRHSLKLVFVYLILITKLRIFRLKCPKYHQNKFPLRFRFSSYVRENIKLHKHLQSINN